MGDSVTWQELVAYVRWLDPREAALYRHPEAKYSAFSFSDRMLVQVFNALLLANWQRGNAGAKAPGPKPPLVELPEPPSAADLERRRLAREFVARHGVASQLKK